MVRSTCSVGVARSPVPLKVVVITGPYPFSNGASTALGNGSVIIPLSVTITVTGVTMSSAVGAGPPIGVLEATLLDISLAAPIDGP